MRELLNGAESSLCLHSLIPQMPAKTVLRVAVVILTFWTVGQHR